MAISEIHAITTADVDGDGIKDVIAGKRLFSHLDSYTDPGSARRRGALRVPHRPRQTRAWGSDVRPAVGPQSIRCRLDGADGDLNKDGAVDILTATNRGTFIFWGSAKKGVRAK